MTEATQTTENKTALHLNDVDENEEKTDGYRQHWVDVKWFLMLSGGLAGVCGPTAGMATFCTVESVRTESKDKQDE